MTRKYIIIVAALAACAVGWYTLRHNGQRDPGLKLFGNVDIRQVELSFRVPG